MHISTSSRDCGFRDISHPWVRTKPFSTPTRLWAATILVLLIKITVQLYRVDKMSMQSRIIFYISTTQIRPWIHFTVISDSISMRKCPSWFVVRIHWRHHWRANASARAWNSCLHSSFVAANFRTPLWSLDYYSPYHCIILKASSIHIQIQIHHTWWRGTPKFSISSH